MREFDKKLLVQVSNMSTGDFREEVEVDVRIEDDVSGVVMAHFRCPASVWWAICTGRVTKVDGWTPPESELLKVGKAMESRSAPLGRAPMQIGSGKADQQQWALNRAEEHVLRGEFDTVEVRSTNQGWQAIFRRWVEVPTDGA